MFIRVKSTPYSQKKSVQICESVRENGKVQQRVIRHVGMATDDVHLEELKKLATIIKRQIIEEREGPFLVPIELLFPEKQQVPDEPQTSHSSIVPLASRETQEELVNAIPVDLATLKEKNRIVEGFHDTFGKLFQELGFHQILPKTPTKVLRDVVLARIASPSSKMRTQRILAADFGKDIPLDRIYRMMDALLEQKDRIQQRVYHATQELCFGKANIMLFDVTTLYFESVEEDELRDFGFSKDQQFHTTQVVLALATTNEGLPIGYRLFPGNTAEVSTLLPCLEEWKRLLHIGEVVFVADRAMMCEKNLKALEEAGVTYIIAAKLKKLPLEAREKILNGPHQIGDEQAVQDFLLANGRRLVVSHSEKRASKDRRDREQGVERMRKKIGQGKNIKKLVPNYGYQKFLKVEGDGKLVVDEGKIDREAAWDGLHGVITNSHTTTSEELFAHYRRLWTIEESFRIQKHNLSLRPIYHFKPERVEAHVLLCYMAFCLMRHLEFRVKIQQEKISMDEMRQELWRVQASILQDEQTGKWYRLPAAASYKAKKIYQALGVKRSVRAHEVKM